MNLLASFIIVQLLAHRMFLPFPLCFQMGAALQAAEHCLGCVLQHLPQRGVLPPGWERCWGLAAAAAASYVHEFMHRGSGQRQSDPAAVVLSVPLFYSFSPSFAAEFRGCCCEREMGKVRCFGLGKERLALSGIGERSMCTICPWEGGREGAGADAGVHGRLLIISSWLWYKYRFGPRGWGVRSLIR